MLSTVDSKFRVEMSSIADAKSLDKVVTKQCLIQFDTYTTVNAVQCTRCPVSIHQNHMIDI